MRKGFFQILAMLLIISFLVQMAAPAFRINASISQMADSNEPDDNKEDEKKEKEEDCKEKISFLLSCIFYPRTALGFKLLNGVATSSAYLSLPEMPPDIA